MQNLKLSPNSLFLKIETNTIMHDLQNTNILNKDRIKLCPCTTLPLLPHPNPDPSPNEILFIRTGSHCSFASFFSFFKIFAQRHVFFFVNLF